VTTGKQKQFQRANEIREHRKTIKRRQEQIAEIKSQLNALQQAAEDIKKHLAPTTGQVVEISSAGSTNVMCFNGHPNVVSYAASREF